MERRLHIFFSFFSNLLKRAMNNIAGSGGRGMFSGGDGVVRELEFLRPLTVSILSERRAVAPFGILGGGPAAKGINLWVRRDGTTVSLGGKATFEAEGGDRLVLMTPGGGGCGPEAAKGGKVERGNAEPSDEELTKKVLAMAEARRGGIGAAAVRGAGSVHKYTRDQETA
jgi:5-oxoprolinase (ATP-hydrolysing)